MNRRELTLAFGAASLMFPQSLVVAVPFEQVTSVCTGSLVLAAAGLLKGYRATSPWYVRDLLPQMGAIADHDRVVIERNRVTGGGVTTGLDFGLTLAALLRSADDARRIEVVLEYAPAPPFYPGTPEEAGEALTRDVLQGERPCLPPQERPPHARQSGSSNEGHTAGTQERALTDKILTASEKRREL